MPANYELPIPSAPPAELGFSAERLRRLGLKLEDDVAQGRLPGAVALIARRGRIGYLQAFGARDPSGSAPMTTDSIFRIYSMTKPIVSVAIMMLWEEGRFMLDEPIGRYLPALADPKVARVVDGQLQLEAATRPITIQDLLRHTSGLTYEFRGGGPVHKQYTAARIARRSQTNADQVDTLGRLPLLHQPGTRWEYSRSTDVLGRLVEVLTGLRLGEFLSQRLFQPLDMPDTAFHVAPDKLDRLAEAFDVDPDTGSRVQLLNVQDAPAFESGGGGLVSTARDYAHFLQMLLGRGTVRGTQLLSRKTVELMTADHLGALAGAQDLLVPGYGFGLGFSVRLQAGIAQMPGSVGQYYWGGLAGTTFFVDPAEQLYAILMLQAPGQREYFRLLFRTMVYAAISD